MAKHADRGDDVHILFLSSGVGARDNAPSIDLNEKTLRCQAAEAAANAVAAQPPRFANFPDNQMDSVPLLEIVRTIETAVSEISPNIIYTHHGDDLNVDHQRVCEATLTACRPLPGSTVERIYAFEVLSSTEWATPSSSRAFIPSRYVEVTVQMDKKRAALTCYGAEMRPPPHARSMEAVEAQAKLRGATAGVSYAEAFVTVREIWKDQ